MMVYDKVRVSRTLRKIFRLLCVFVGLNCVMAGIMRGAMTRGDRGFKPGMLPRYSRHDNNFFAMLGELDDDDAQDGDLHDIVGTFTSGSGDAGGYTMVRSKQSKRQRISSGGQSGPVDLPQDDDAMFDDDFEDLSMDQKLSLILSKLSVNENKVNYIQNKLDSVTAIRPRVARVENVVKSHNDRLKLLEYRSLDLEARSRRKNLLLKGIPEERRENCFDEVRKFIREQLGIDRDMYLERAHRLGRFKSNKTRPIIVAFRDFCDTLEILDASPSLRDTGYGVSRDYPSEISKARQSLWSQYKATRDANRKKKVTMEFPARICIDGVVIVDAFPDWYPILQGSRVSCVPQSQSGGQTIINSGSNTTGSTSSSAVGPRDTPLVNVLSMGQPSMSHTDVNIVSSQMFTQDDTQERMEEGEPSSPSLLENVNPVPVIDGSAGTSMVPPPPPLGRGRSPARKPITGAKSRAKSVSKGRKSAQPAQRSKSKSRSQSRSSQSRGAMDSNQAAGGNSKEPPQTPSNKTDCDKTVTQSRSDTIPLNGSPV